MTKTVEKAARIDSFDLSDDFRHITIANTPYLLDYEDTGEQITLFHEGYRLQDIHTESIDAISNSKQRFFICPSCGKRVRYLYINSTGFKCRMCSKLTYSIQQENHDCIWYYDHGVQFAKDYLAWIPPDYLVPVDFGGETPKRPPGMQRKVYKKLLKKFRWYQAMYEKKYYEELQAILSRPVKIY